MGRKQVSNEDIERLQGKVLDDYFWKYYENNELHLCSLCGNSGVIDTRKSAISYGDVNVGRLNYCICPNGRGMRESGAELIGIEGRAEQMRKHFEKLAAWKKKIGFDENETDE